MINESRKLGWVQRVHASEVSDVEPRVARAVKVVSTIREHSDGPVAILVPSDKDCGHTLSVLRATLHEDGLEENVLAVGESGSPNTDVLNSGLRLLQKEGATHAAIVSNKAVKAITPGIMAEICKATSLGAKGIGIAFDDFAEGVLKGAILNTFAVWEIESALSLGGFSYEHGGEKGGVEEISLQLALIEKFGRCMAVVAMKASLYVHSTPEAIQRHQEVKGSKIPRQNDLLSENGGSFETLAGAIMEGYPVEV